MTRPGQIALLRFPQTDLRPGKLRPVLVLARAPGPFDDWLVCMVSSQLHQAVEGFDEILFAGDPAFAASGLKVASVIRLARVAVVDGATLLGAIGDLPAERMDMLRARLAEWVRAVPDAAAPPPDESSSGA